MLSAVLALRNLRGGYHHYSPQHSRDGGIDVRSTIKNPSGLGDITSESKGPFVPVRIFDSKSCADCPLVNRRLPSSKMLDGLCSLILAIPCAIQRQEKKWGCLLIELPEWIDKEAWRGFEEMRKKMRKPLTDYARRLALKKLEAIYREFGHHPTDVIEQSILCGYQGFWPIATGRSNRRDEELSRELHVGRGPEARH